MPDVCVVCLEDPATKGDFCTICKRTLRTLQIPYFKPSRIHLAKLELRILKLEQAMREVLHG